MAKKAKKTARGRKQDRARVAGGAGLRSPLRSEEIPQVGRSGQESGKKGRQQSEEKCGKSYQGTPSE